MKPKFILLFMAVVMAICWLVSAFMPVKGIPISEKISITFSWNPFDDTASTYANIADIINNNQPVENPFIEPLPNNEDTITTSVSTKVIKEVHPLTRSIEYPNNDTTVLFPFFEQLEQSHSRQVRVFHYGDSQIEGDRITGYLRYKFQSQFGGSGPGLLPAIPPMAESASILHQASENWKKHAVYFDGDTLLSHRCFGLLGSFSCFGPSKGHTVSENRSINSANISFSRSAMAYSNVNNYNICRIFYRNPTSTVSLSGLINDSLVWFENLDSGTATKVVEWQFSQPPKKFDINFSGENSPEVYAVSLDSKVGVAVDNLPLRGSSGAEFTKLDFGQYTQMADLLNGGLIIYQFGVNVVPHKVNGYTFYQKIIEREINCLKQAIPGIPVIIVCVSDMSEKNGDYFQTYSNLEKVIEAQRKAAQTTGSAFWNLYEAMGGKNSMPAWVNASPPLAQKDYIHFNRKGGHIVAQMLYVAIESEYQKYGRTKKQLTLH